MAGHHTPDETGKFTGDSGSGDIAWAREADSFEFAFETFVSFVGISNDLRFVSLLSGFQCLGLCSCLTSTVALSGFCEQCSQVGISFPGNTRSADVCTAGMFTRNKAQICREMVR